MKPIIVLNFKAYQESVGDSAVKLAKAVEKVSKSGKALVVVAVQNSDVYRVSKSVSIPVIAQHADAAEFGAHTGSQLPECIKANGAWGSLVNHAEDRVGVEETGKVVARCRAIGLKTIVCVEDLAKANEIARMQPDYLAFEDPALIGTGKSISQIRPDDVKQFADIVNKANRETGGKTIALCGAGVSNHGDYRKALELGTGGVLLAKAIIMAGNPGKALEELIG
jgi:triosephosphate isomerase (TIM)